MSERIDKIKAAVEKAAGCPEVHLESAVVVETFRGQTMWEGVVKQFELQDHPKAKRADGWINGTGPDARYTSMLELPPVKSANTAVRAAIVASSKQ